MPSTHGAYTMPKDCMYLAEHQRISTDPENILIRSIAQKVSKSASKGKEKAKAADKGKRVADDNGNSSAPKRPRDEAGPSGMPCMHSGYSVDGLLQYRVVFVSCRVLSRE